MRTYIYMWSTIILLTFVTLSGPLLTFFAYIPSVFLFFIHHSNPSISFLAHKNLILRGYSFCVSFLKDAHKSKYIGDVIGFVVQYIC